jgi:hypothetical protein
MGANQSMTILFAEDHKLVGTTYTERGNASCLPTDFIERPNLEKFRWDEGGWQEVAKPIVKSGI